MREGGGQTSGRRVKGAGANRQKKCRRCGGGIKVGEKVMDQQQFETLTASTFENRFHNRIEKEYNIPTTEIINTLWLPSL